MNAELSDPDGSSRAQSAGMNVAVDGAVRPWARRHGATASSFSRVQKASGVRKTPSAEAELLLCFDSRARRTGKCFLTVVSLQPCGMCSASIYANVSSPSEDAGSSDSQTLTQPRWALSQGLKRSL